MNETIPIFEVETETGALVITTPTPPVIEKYLPKDIEQGLIDADALRVSAEEQRVLWQSRKDKLAEILPQ